MRTLDADAGRAVRVVQLYLSEPEARSLRGLLDGLLAHPEASEHEHLYSADQGAELSLSIVTPPKLQSGRYTRLERDPLGAK